MSNPEEEPVNAIRESTRWLMSTKRRAFREENADQIRHLSIPRSSPEKILEIINKLKTKSVIKLEELNLLKNELLNSESYVKTLLNTHGALRGLVRELSGKDIKKQCGSAGCFCNISLGDQHSCLVVAKMAGSYLVTALDSASVELKTTSAWALGNLFGSGTKVCELLQSQGVTHKLQVMLKSSDQDVYESALYAVTHYVHSMLYDLSIETFLDSVLQRPLTETSRLIFMISCHKEFTTILLENNNILDRLVALTQTEIQNKLYDNNQVYFIRILANICSNHKICDMFMNKITFEALYNYLKVIKMECKDESLNNAVNWLLGNVLVFSSDCGFKDCFFNQIAVDFV